MLEKDKVYTKEQWEQEVSGTPFVGGIQKDILKDRFAPNAYYGDFFLAISRNGRWIYSAQMVDDDSLMGKLLHKRNIKVLGVITKDEYDRI